MPTINEGKETVLYITEIGPKMKCKLFGHKWEYSGQGDTICSECGGCLISLVYTMMRTT